MSETPPPNEPVRRPRYEPIRMGGMVKRGAVALYALLAVGLAFTAMYMATLGQRDIMSMYVAGPAIGALWFGLRVFMLVRPRS